MKIKATKKTVYQCPSCNTELEIDKRLLGNRKGKKVKKKLF